MEDGSIYVCFVCGKEFSQVVELNKHMENHEESSGNVDESMEDGYDDMNSEDEDDEEEEMDEDFNGEDKYVNEVDANLMKKELPSHYIELKGAVNGQTSPDGSSGPSQSLAYNIKNEKEKSNMNKSGDDTINCAMRRAMNLKRYIERQVKAAMSNPEDSMSKEGAKNEFLSDEEETVGDTVSERVVMVDKSFFNSGVSSLPVGPTVLNAAEPEGFVVPYSNLLSSQDESPIADASDESEVKEESSKKKVFNYVDVKIVDQPFKTGSVNGIQSTLKEGAHVFGQFKYLKKSRKRGNSRRGRPSKHNVYQDLDLEDLALVNKQRGRGYQSKGKNSELFYQCSKCDKPFKSLSALKSHSNSHLINKVIPCPYCKEVFPQRYILYDHLICVHGDEVKDIVCPICSKVFTRPDSLKSHMVRMHEENGGLNCIICGKNFPGQGQLEIHMRIHTGERPFQCDICSKGFVQKVHLNTHMLKMHNLTEVNTTPCRLCHKKFSNRIALREHVTSDHKLSGPQYKNYVARLRKDGVIPEVTPSTVKVVDPLLRYRKLDASLLKDKVEKNNIEMVDSFSDTSGEHYFTRNSKKKFKTKIGQSEKRAPGMGTVIDFSSSDMIFTPMNFGENEEQKGRDQDELKIVESAFKVVEEMDQLKENTTAILIPEDCVSSSIYYPIQVEVDSSQGVEYTHFSVDSIQELNSEASQEEGDKEYSTFATDHAQIEVSNPEELGVDSSMESSSFLSNVAVKVEAFDISVGDCNKM